MFSSKYRRVGKVKSNKMHTHTLLIEKNLDKGKFQIIELFVIQSRKLYVISY